MVTPLFLFSLPRSGSTLVQRVLAQHPAVSTQGEPWLLLPFLYALRKDGVYAEYGHRVMAGAVADLCGQLPGGHQSYLDEVRHLATRIYGQLADPHATYFLDKTPRYHLVCQEILDTFKDAKFIFLWRNPLAVVASSVGTWSGGRWAIHGYKVDLYEGLSRLVDAFRANGNRACSIRYEDFVSAPQQTATRLFEYLDLEYSDDQLVAGTRAENIGRLGDPSGTKRYRSLSREPLNKWRDAVSNPIRRAWCRRYLEWIGADRLRTIGYDYDALVRELDAIPHGASNTISDVVSLGRSFVANWLEPDILRHKVQLLPASWKVHPHR